MGLRHLSSESGTGRIQMTGLHKFLFPFSDWTKYAPFDFNGEMYETFTGPEDVFFGDWKGLNVSVPNLFPLYFNLFPAHAIFPQGKLVGIQFMKIVHLARKGVPHESC